MILLTPIDEQDLSDIILSECKYPELSDQQEDPVHSEPPMQMTDIFSLSGNKATKVSRNKPMNSRDEPLRHFRKYRSPEEHPNIEGLRIFIIRAHKRLNRFIECGKYPMSKQININHNIPTVGRLFEKLKVIFFNEHLQETSSTGMGPLTDGKAKRTDNSLIQKTFNNKYCQGYFSELGVRESYYFFVELLFEEFELNLLCSRFSLRCCRDEHRSECVSAWLGLKRYLQVEILVSIKLQPWFPHEEAELVN